MAAPDRANESIVIRPFEPDEWRSFRAFRLAALKDAPNVFSASHDEAATRPDETWQATICGLDHQTFGLFDGETLIGITAVFTLNEDPTKQTALLAMSYIERAYRGRDLSRLLYDARLAWIKAQPHFTRVVVSHRASNDASRRANQRHGFVRTGSTSRLWPDGTTEDEIHYELLLSR